MITHHPAKDVLFAYAAGTTQEAVSLVVATHLALCPDCRCSVSLAERAGGAMLENFAPEPMTTAAWERVQSRLDDLRPIHSAVPVPGRETGAPEPLRTYLDGDLDSVRWISVTRGLAYRPILVGDCRVQLVRTKPGHRISLHTHGGDEFSLVLTGGFTDCSGQYRRGDFQTATRELLHRPMADKGEDCIILTVADAPLMFRNPFVGLMAKLMGF